MIVQKVRLKSVMVWFVGGLWGYYSAEGMKDERRGNIVSSLRDSKPSYTLPQQRLTPLPVMCRPLGAGGSALIK